MTARVICGDVRDVLPSLPAESVQTVVTSPPYYALRSYLPNGHEDKHREIGTEQTPDDYVAQIVAVMREVRRVLRNDGTCWLNLGDSYAGSWGNYGGQNRGNGKQRAITNGSKAPQKAYDGLESWRPATSSVAGLKPKDLIGIPWRVAFALQADGWWLRSDIIWHKPNCMPESVTDRPTRTHEYLFLLTKSERYYFDADAIREESSPSAVARRGLVKVSSGEKDLFRGESYEYGMGRNKRSVWTVATQPFRDAHFATFPEALVDPCVLAGTSAAGGCAACGAPWRRIILTTPSASMSNGYASHATKRHMPPCSR